MGPLIDIGDTDRAVAEMARVLRPRGTLLIANLTSFATAGADGGWQPGACTSASTITSTSGRNEASRIEQGAPRRLLATKRPVRIAGESDVPSGSQESPTSRPVEGLALFAAGEK